MFGRSLFKDFEEDPFFSGASEHMRDLNRHLGANSFPGNMLEDSGSRRRDRPNDRDRGRDRDGSRDVSLFDPGFGFGNMFGHMDAMMKSMQEGMRNSMKSFETSMNDPNGHSFQQASFMSYTNTGEGAPQVYQTTTSTRRAPGGVKETRKALRDTRANMEKMSIGHHINDRGHVVERHKNTKTGETDERQNYVNLDEADAPAFDREFREKIEKHRSLFESDRGRHQSNRDLEYRPGREGQRALPSSSSGAEHWGRTPDRERDDKYRSDKHRDDRYLEDRYRDNHRTRDRDERGLRDRK